MNCYSPLKSQHRTAWCQVVIFTRILLIYLLSIMLPGQGEGAVSILQMRKLRLRVVKARVQGHIATKRQSQGPELLQWFFPFPRLLFWGGGGGVPIPLSTLVWLHSLVVTSCLHLLPPKWELCSLARSFLGPQCPAVGSLGCLASIGDQDEGAAQSGCAVALRVSQVCAECFQSRDFMYASPKPGEVGAPFYR